MSHIITSDFFHNLRMVPDGSKQVAKILDEVRWCFQYRDRPIQKVCQAISQFHGPFNGASPQLAQLINVIAGKSKVLSELANTVGDAVSIVESAIQGVEQVVNTINQLTAMNFSTPFLRFFVKECQVLHPQVTEFIKNNIGMFPYFEQISESVGSMFTIITDINELSQLFTLECGQMPFKNLKSASRMVRSIFDKMFLYASGNMEDSQKFLDTLFMRAMPCEDNHGLTHPDYLNEGPVAHGNNHCMDVFHQPRAEAAVPGVFAKLVALFGDRLRLLNSVFPVKYNVNFKDKTYNVQVENETVQVDRLNKIYPAKVYTDEMLKAEEKEFKEDKN